MIKQILPVSAKLIAIFSLEIKEGGQKPEMQVESIFLPGLKSPVRPSEPMTHGF